MPSGYLTDKTMISTASRSLVLALTAIYLLLSADLASATDQSQPTIKSSRISTTTFQGISKSYEYSAIEDTDSAHGSNNGSNNGDKDGEYSQAGKPGKERTVQHHNHGLSVFDVVIGLNTDLDFDGHYSTFSVELDLDANFEAHTVYAVLYLRQNNGPWFEYAVTSDFQVAGNSTQDSVFIETSLDSGYPSGYYDHYLEVYDAYDNSLLLTYGPDQSFHVTNLPFESYSDDHFVSTASVQLTFTGSGSFAPLSLLTFLSLALLRSRYRSSTS